jgi:hypothetical protein
MKYIVKPTHLREWGFCFRGCGCVGGNCYKVGPEVENEDKEENVR